MKLVIKATSVVVGGLHPKLHKMFVQVKSEIYVRARLQVLGSQCSDMPGNRTPPSLSPGLHTLAQCWGGGSPFQISTNTLHQTVMCECEWGEEGRVSGPTGPMMVTSGFPVP